MKTPVQNLLLVLVLTATWLMKPAGAMADILYVSDAGGGIYKLDSAISGGNVSTFAASGLYGSLGLACNSSSNLFAATSLNGNYDILEFTPAGSQSIFASGFVQVEGLAFDSNGNLFAADGGSGNGTIYKFTPGGSQSTFVNGGVLGGGVRGLAIDSSNNLFVADNLGGSGYIYKFTPGGSQSTFASGLDVPSGLAFDSSGNLFVAVIGSILKFTPGGVMSTFATGLDAPYGLAFDSSGNLFEADYASGNIYEFTPGGGQSTFATNLDQPAFLAFAPTAATPPPPSLHIASVGNQSILFWPASGTNYVLQSTTNLASPNWVTVSNGAPIIGVTLTNNLPAAFFRLQQQ